MIACAYCISEGKGAGTPAITTVGGTACCRDHAEKMLAKQAPARKSPRAGDHFQKLA